MVRMWFSSRLCLRSASSSLMVTLATALRLPVATFAGVCSTGDNTLRNRGEAKLPRPGTFLLFLPDGQGVVDSPPDVEIPLPVAILQFGINE